MERKVNEHGRRIDEIIICLSEKNIIKIIDVYLWEHLIRTE